MIVEFDTGTWTDPFVQELPPLGKLLFNYLWTNSHKNIACLYTITFKTIRDETGLSQKQIEDTLSILYPKVLYDPGEHLVFVVNHVKRTFLRTGKISPKIVAGIFKNILAIREGHFLVGIFLNKYKDLALEYPYPIDTVPEGYQDTFQVQSSRFKVQGSELKGGTGGDRKFIPPTVEEVRAYCEERNNGIDPQYFVDKNQTAGWVTGKARNPVKDWKALVRTWEANKKIYASDKVTSAQTSIPPDQDVAAKIRAEEKRRRELEQGAGNA